MVRLIKMADPPPYGQLFVIFFGIHSTLDYDNMCPKTDFTQEKRHFQSNTRISNSFSTAVAMSRYSRIAL